MLRILTGIPHPYISRVSNATTSSRCQATRFSIQILRSQLRWLGHILRRPETDPLRLVVLEPGTELLPRLTSTGRKRVVGRPRIDWAQTLIEIYCSFAQCSRSRMLETKVPFYSQTKVPLYSQIKVPLYSREPMYTHSTTRTIIFHFLLIFVAK